jgi:polynucleotide 5'-hydroxyl-kinase GRC3/NOL9
MPPSDGWRAALDAVLGARVTVVIGASDAGKTTLVTALASDLSSRGARVGVVDADVGQSEIGPPTTVGLGRITARVDRLSGAELIAFQFVGVSSPARDIGGVVEATRRIVERARAQPFARVLVDTSGLVLGWPGHRLKQRKIEAVDPDLLVALERADECAPILERYAGAARPRVLRLPAMGRAGSRSQIARREHRARAFDAYLRDAGAVAVARSAVELPRGGQWTEVAGALCGLDDAGGDTIALGLVEEVRGDVVSVLAPLPRGARVTRVRVGRERKDGTAWSAPAGPGRSASSLGG